MADRSPPADLSLSRGRTRRLEERLADLAFTACAGVLGLVTLVMVVTLVSETVSFFSQVSFLEFFLDSRWTPLFREKHFGILPLLSGSVMVMVGAGLVSLPAGLFAAVFMSEHANARARSIMKPVLEVLAGIPTVVYGYFALTLVTPALRGIIPGLGAFNALSASLVVGLMILPTVASLSWDALRAVPWSVREAAYGLGASKMEVATRVVVPAALPGVVASFLLGLSRALGETIIVSLVAGNSAELAMNPLDSLQTMTAYVLQVGMGDLSPGTLEYQTLFAVGTTLFAITMAMGLASQWIRSRGGRFVP